MGRIFDLLKVGSERLYTIFDSGSRNSYVRRGAAASGRLLPLHRPFRTAIGGESHSAREICVLEGSIRGKAVMVSAFVLREIGEDEGGRPIDLLYGANAMQDFGIRLDPDWQSQLAGREAIDLSHYHRGVIEL